jgi:poly(A) polymerase
VRDDEDEDRVTDEHGRILRDNAYGNIDDDVWRRDFTANSLYYNIADFSIWDYTGGVADIAARRLKLIGDPVTRYREDPVRMLRAARFEAKLGFTLDGETGTAITSLRELLGSVPPARLFDETLKLFLTGHGARSLEVLRARGLLTELMPTVGGYLDRHPDGAVARLLVQGLKNTDLRVQQGKPVTPTFLFALLLYGPFAEIIEKQPQEKWHDIGTIVDAVDRAARAAQGRIGIPKRFTLGVREMFAAQPRLEQPRGRRALRMLEQPRFRAGFDLLLLRAEMGLAARDIAEWWTRVQEASQTDRDRMADALGARERTPGEGGGQRRPRHRRRRGRGGRAPAAT